MRVPTILSLILLFAISQFGFCQEMAMDDKVNSILAKIQRLKGELNEARGVPQQAGAQWVLGDVDQDSSKRFAPFKSQPIADIQPLVPPQTQPLTEFRNIAPAGTSIEPALVPPNGQGFVPGELPSSMPSVVAPQGSMLPETTWRSQSRVVHQPLPPADAILAPPLNANYPPSALEGYYEAQPYPAPAVLSQSRTFHGAIVPQTLPRQAIPPQAYGVYQDQPIIANYPNPAFVNQYYQPYPAMVPGMGDPRLIQPPNGNGLYFGPNGWGLGIGGVQLHFRGNQGRGHAGYPPNQFRGHPGKGHGNRGNGKGRGNSR